MDEKGSLLEKIGKEAAEIEKCMRLDLDGLQPSIDSLLYETLEYGLLNGGKRIRPLLVVLSSRLCGSFDEKAYALGCAFEYLHCATLFHDDIIDGSDTRRGKPSVYKKFGTVAAILAGDFLHAHSMAIVGRYAGTTGLSVFCNATTGMVDGEFMQLKNAEKLNLSELDYYEAIMGKTGLLIAAACEVGAIFGNGNLQQQKALKSYGENLGRAFQIVDDLLDYQGDTQKTGKAVGNDLVEGKMTLPLILCMKEASSEHRERLLEILADKVDRKKHFAEVYAIIEHYDCFSKVKEHALSFVKEAIKDLALFSKSEGSVEKGILEKLAGYVVTRQK